MVKLYTPNLKWLGTVPNKLTTDGQRDALNGKQRKVVVDKR